MQDLFVECFRLSRTRPIRHWRTFVTRLATFRSLDQLRRLKSLQSIDAVSLVHGSNGPEAEAMAREMVQQLRAAVALLPDRQATVFCLHHFEELSRSEIAAMLDLSLNAVSMALYKARKSLRSRFADLHRESRG